jgi:signal transduction histidine kinase
VQPQNVISIDGGDAAEGQLFDSPERGVFRNNNLLTGISPAAYEQIEPKIEVMRCAPRELIFQEDEPGDCLYLIAQGSVKISKKGRGGQQETLAFLMEQDFFGEMALIDRGQRSAQAAAVGHTILGRIDRQTWNLLIRVAPNEVLSNFTKSVTKRLRDNNQHFIEQMMRSERLSLLGTTISSIVHDMNNPISTILGACQVIQGNKQDQLTDQMAGLIRESIDRMESMTRELIDFSRGDTQLKLKLVSIPEFVRQLEPDFTKCRVACDVQIAVGFEGSVRMDRHRMLRVFGNLIKNAREAMKVGDPNVLRFRVRQVESHLEFEVSDNGHGINSEILPKIFEPFMTYGKSTGTGLGLAISKAVVEAHNGAIAVSSSEKGTTFRIDLPLTRA